MTTESVWKVIDAKGHSEGGTDYMAITVAGRGQVYVIVVTGPAGMTCKDMMDSQRAALGATVQAAGIDPSEVLAHVRLLDDGELAPTGAVN